MLITIEGAEQLSLPPTVNVTGAAQVPAIALTTMLDGQLMVGGVLSMTVMVCAALAEAGFQAEASADIRQDIWYKLWGNMTLNPVSALTGALSDRILRPRPVRA